MTKKRPVRSTPNRAKRKAASSRPHHEPNPALWDYAAEKLGAAVTVLATHPEEVRRRLYWAFEHLALVPDRSLPVHLQDLYREIILALTRMEPPEPGLSRVNWNLHRMRKATGSKIAERILQLDSELESLLQSRC